MIFSLYTGFSVMVAGSGAIFKQELNLSFNIGVIFMIICAFLVFLFSLEGLSFINSILVPLLIIGIIFITLYVNINGGYNFSNVEGANITKKREFHNLIFIIFWLQFINYNHSIFFPSSSN